MGVASSGPSFDLRVPWREVCALYGVPDAPVGALTYMMTHIEPLQFALCAPLRRFNDCVPCFFGIVPFKDKPLSEMELVQQYLNVLHSKGEFLFLFCIIVGPWLFFYDERRRVVAISNVLRSAPIVTFCLGAIQVGKLSVAFERICDFFVRLNTRHVQSMSHMRFPFEVSKRLGLESSVFTDIHWHAFFKQVARGCCSFCIDLDGTSHIFYHTMELVSFIQTFFNDDQVPTLVMAFAAALTRLELLADRHVSGFVHSSSSSSWQAYPGLAMTGLAFADYLCDYVHMVVLVKSAFLIPRERLFRHSDFFDSSPLPVCFHSSPLIPDGLIVFDASGSIPGLSLFTLNGDVGLVLSHGDIIRGVCCPCSNELIVGAPSAPRIKIRSKFNIHLDFVWRQGNLACFCYLSSMLFCLHLKDSGEVVSSIFSITDLGLVRTACPLYDKYTQSICGFVALGTDGKVMINGTTLHGLNCAGVIDMLVDEDGTVFIFSHDHFCEISLEFSLYKMKSYPEERSFVCINRERSTVVLSFPGSFDPYIVLSHLDSVSLIPHEMASTSPLRVSSHFRAQLASVLDFPVKPAVQELIDSFVFY